MGAPEDRHTKLAELERRIREARGPVSPKRGASVAEKYNSATMAWRMVLELVLGVLIGVALGWGIDWLAGTLPVFLMIFGLLGFAGGVRTMMYSADQLNRSIAREKAEAEASARQDEAR